MKKFNTLRLDLAEKTLTPAEKKKREEIAMAMERENPGMPMGKKMAIATAAAKRVAEENLDELKTDTLDSYITKVATGPSRGNTQTGIPKSIKAISGVTTAIRKKAEQMKEEIETTHEDPLVVTKDSDGNIHTHANLSVANAIHGTDVKHQAIHTGMPIQAGKFTFELSKHHASEVKEAKEKTEYDYEGDMARGQLQSIIMNAQRVHDMLKDNDNLPEWVQSKITLAEDYISTVSNYMSSEVDEETEIKEEKPGLWANIHAKRKRIASGSGERMRKPGSEGAPRAQDFKDAAKTSKNEEVQAIEETSHTFEPATHKPTIRNSKGHSFEGNTYNAKGLKGASIYKTKDTGKYYANKIDANTTFHSSAKEAADKYHTKAK